MSQANESITSIKFAVLNPFVNQSKEKLALNLIYEYEKIQSMQNTAGLSKALKLRELQSAISQFVKDYPNDDKQINSSLG